MLFLVFANGSISNCIGLYSLFHKNNKTSGKKKNNNNSQQHGIFKPNLVIFAEVEILCDNVYIFQKTIQVQP